MEKVIDLIKNGFLTLDVEFGSAKGFFSGSNAGLSDPLMYQCSLQRTMQGGIGPAHITISEDFEPNGITAERTLVFKPESDIALFDLVSRFIVLSDSRPATIAGKIFRHTSSNIYHQFPVKSARVPIGRDRWLTIRDNGTPDLPGFEQVFYIRDERILASGMRRWIVHHRQIALLDAAELVIRGCNPRIEGPLPFQWLFPRRLKEALFRVREVRFPNCPVMCVGEVSLPKGIAISLRTQIEVSGDI
jgi:hypothetical protein